MKEVKLHDIGEGLTEAEVIKCWVVSGQFVEADEPLLEIQTDKMTAELPSPSAGVVKEVRVEEGDTITVGTTVIVLENETSDRDREVEKPPPSFQKKKKVPDKDNKYNRVRAAPYTRKIARDYGIQVEEIAKVHSSDIVTEEDVHQYVSINKKREPENESKFTPSTNLMKSSKQKDSDRKGAGSAEILPFKGVRKQIAKRMTHSLFTIPHVTHFEEVDMSRLYELKEELKRVDSSISATAFFVKALVIALKDFPIFNAELDDEKEVIYLKKEYHIGLAADSKQGLLVPVLREADKKTIRELHEEIKNLNERVRGGTLSPSEMKGSTITISNVGPMGSIGATPIINYPETGLVSFHKTKKRAVVTEKDEIVVRPMMNISMSFDHRVADGGTAVSFTNRLAEILENPKELLLHLR
ncbi:dihydrolipoamide acetyltransferase family protein [Alteribacillus iranensis]|uniref:Dihydrolipoamide acetyltransferase component of pyruvate dehydrogenase complex n=1 Tax=Alteribacillus iranensis TaxID=930128 RepID=A0A1I2ADZ8_9BACI|nr:dihydrolipoamide acetyltransferase family protein [Alteribacillus iranensis]SFE41778.1 pyruvate dehydrogenase E2 component (dihydrolipoamide acetyltransferase) [Alteribacillus iranensis]